jgi:hypothetical protein
LEILASGAEFGELRRIRDEGFVAKLINDFFGECVIYIELPLFKL